MPVIYWNTVLIGLIVCHQMVMALMVAASHGNFGKHSNVQIAGTANLLQLHPQLAVKNKHTHKKRR